MLITCSNCRSVLEKTNDETNMVSGWYRDNTGNHTAIVCKKCFTIHDVVGSLNIVAMLLGKQSFKIIKVIRPEELNRMLSMAAAESEAVDLKNGIPKTMAEHYYTMPFAIMKVRLGMPDNLSNFLIENGIVKDPVERL